MRDDNVLRRHIKPAGQRAGLPRVNWLALRRSFATWCKINHVEPKDAQAMMRHSRIQTTLDIYQQIVPDSIRDAVENKLPALPQ